MPVYLTTTEASHEKPEVETEHVTELAGQDDDTFCYILQHKTYGLRDPHIGREGRLRRWESRYNT